MGISVGAVAVRAVAIRPLAFETGGGVGSFVAGVVGRFVGRFIGLTITGGTSFSLVGCFVSTLGSGVTVWTGSGVGSFTVWTRSEIPGFGADSFVSIGFNVLILVGLLVGLLVVGNEIGGLVFEIITSSEAVLPQRWS